jgi:hypothetical protein
MRKLYIILEVASLLGFLLLSSFNGYGQMILMDKNTDISNCRTFGNCKVSKKAEGIVLEFMGNDALSGSTFPGEWDLQIYDQLEITLKNNSSTTKKIFIRLENQDMVTEHFKEKGMFRNVISTNSGECKTITMDIPRKWFYPEIEKKLFGMHINPYGTNGDRYTSDHIMNLAPDRVTAMTIYQRENSGVGSICISKIRMLNHGRYEVPVWMTLPEDKFFPFVDELGQFKFKEWEGKTHSESDLLENLAKEEKEIAEKPGPYDWDKYGGWNGGPKQDAKGYFYVKKIDGKWWMVDPDGNLYWSHGVVRVSPSCGETPIDNREFYFTNLPSKEDPEFGQFYDIHDELLRPYYEKRGIKETYNFTAANLKRQFGEDWMQKFGEFSHKRLKSWGMNTIANSSDKQIYKMDKTPYCDRFELKSPAIEGGHGSGWWFDFRDPFHHEFKANVRKKLIERMDEINDPWCFGFFVDNELNWGDDYFLAHITLNSSSSQPAKKEFMKFLKKRYKTISGLNAKWGTDYKNWKDFMNRKLIPGEDSNVDCREFSKIVIDAYFKNINEVFKKVAPQKLYMGCRFAGGSREDVITIAAKHCDIISYNIYRYDLSQFKLPEGVDKPVIIGEFHFGTLDRGLFHPGQIGVENQTVRGQCYYNYVKSALENPYVVGTHWHQYTDQMVTGRFDGECLECGLTDVCNKPYEELIARIREIGYKLYNIRSGK